MRGARALWASWLALGAGACTLPTAEGDANAVASAGEPGPTIVVARRDERGLYLAWTFDHEPSVFNVRVRRDGVDEPQIELDGRARDWSSRGDRAGARDVRLLVQACRRVLLQPSVCTSWSEQAAAP